MREPNDDHFISGRRCNSVGPRVPVASFWLTAMVALLSAMVGSASADTEVRGVPDAMYLRAENASVSEVLAALAAEFNLKYPSKPNLDRVVTGVYSGTLGHVLTRILHGSTYVIRFFGDDVEIKVLVDASAIDPPRSSFAVAVNQNPVASSTRAATVASRPSQIAPLVPK